LIAAEIGAVGCLRDSWVARIEPAVGELAEPERFERDERTAVGREAWAGAFHLDDGAQRLGFNT
jgi:hypothetical protein